MRSLVRLSCVFAFATTAACGGGGGSGSGSGSGDSFSVSPSSIEYTATFSGPAPDTKTITVRAQAEETRAPDIAVSGDGLKTGYYDYCYGDIRSDLHCSGNESSITVYVTAQVPSELGVGTHRATIEIKNDNDRVTVPVDYEVTPGEPVVEYATPYPAIAGEATEVTIRGNGFLALDDTSVSVTAGDTTATAVQVRNNTTIIAELPPMPAGDYAVAVTGEGPEFDSSARLIVADAQTFPAASWSTGNTVSSLEFDFVRHALFVVTDPGDIQRYGYGSGAWDESPGETLRVDGVRAITLSTRGDILIGGGHNRIYEFDPVTVALTESVEIEEPAFGSTDCTYDPCFDTVAMSSNGEIIALDNNQWNYYYFYDPAGGTVDSSKDYFGFTNGSHVYNAAVVGSANGNRAVITDETPVVYDATARDLIAVNSTDFPSSKAMSADGMLLNLGEEILKASDDAYLSYALLPVKPIAAAFSPDGETIYIYPRDESVIKSFDVANSGTPVFKRDIPLDVLPGDWPKMEVAPDGNTLFIAGDTNALVVPLQ